MRSLSPLLIALLSATAFALPKKHKGTLPGAVPAGSAPLVPLDDEWAAKLVPERVGTHKDGTFLPITNCTYTQEIPYEDMVDGTERYNSHIFTWFTVKGFYWNKTEKEVYGALEEMHHWKTYQDRGSFLNLKDWNWTEPYTIAKGLGGKPMTGFKATFTFKESGDSSTYIDQVRYDRSELFNVGPEWESPVWCTRVQRFRGEYESDKAGRCNLKHGCYYPADYNGPPNNGPGWPVEPKPKKMPDGVWDEQANYDNQGFAYNELYPGDAQPWSPVATPR